MKKILVITGLIMFAFSAYGQRHGQMIKWLSLSAKAGAGNSVLFNSDAFNEKYAELNLLTPAFTYGSRFTLTFGDNIGLGADLTVNSFGQNFSISDPDFRYKKDVKLQSLDYSVFFRYSGDRGGYFEIGPMFTVLKSAEESNTIEANFNRPDDLLDVYLNNYTNIMIGAGRSIARTERLDFNLGLRLNYGLDDLAEDDNFYVLDDGVFHPDIISDKTTNPVSLKIIAEINYYFGFWGDASCQRGRLVFFQ